MSQLKNILAIDVGSKRVGLAVANNIAKIAKPLTILQNNDLIFSSIQEVIEEQKIDQIVVGLPRNLAGEETQQSAYSREFAVVLGKKIPQKIDLADETLSTKRAESTKYQSDPSVYPDAVAACFILEEYLERNT